MFYNVYRLILFQESHRFERSWEGTKPHALTFF
jgi:hypothetical protein